MPLFSETEEKIFGDVLIDVVDNTTITRSSPGSKMRALVEAVSRKMGRMWGQFDLNVGQAFLDGANGRYLTFLGEMMGLPRLGAKPADVSFNDKLIKFYVNVGTFGDINGGSPILIPSGTIISTGKNGTGTQYRTVLNTILTASASELYVSARSVSTGEHVNIGARKLVYHNFTNYADSINSSLYVTNEADIVLGRDLENDANYKFRIANQMLSVEKANSTAIRLAALAVPGVGDVVMLPYHRGIGTYDLLIKSVTPTVSPSLIDTVQNEIIKVSSEGIVPRARGPVEVGISLVGTLTLKKAIPGDEEDTIISNVTTNITDYINNLDIGEELIVNELVERVMGTSDLIKNIGRAGQPFDNMFSYTPSKLQDNKVRATLLADITPKLDQRLIVENRYAGDTPILFRTV